MMPSGSEVRRFGQRCPNLAQTWPESADFGPLDFGPLWAGLWTASANPIPERLGCLGAQRLGSAASRLEDCADYRQKPCRELQLGTKKATLDMDSDEDRYNPQRKKLR